MKERGAPFKPVMKGKWPLGRPVCRVLSFGALVLVFGVLAGIPELALASQQAPAPRKGRTDFPWTGPEYRECGQNCLYEKGNENLSIQALTTINRVNDLYDFQRDGKYQEILDRLGTFCETNGIQAKGKPEEKAKECLGRYRDFQVYTLTRIKAGLIQNNTNVARLQEGTAPGSNLTTVGGQAPDTRVVAAFARYMDEKDATKKAQSPYVPFFEDLQAKYAEMIKAGNQGNYAEWLGDLEREPRPEDFVKWREILRNPKNKGGERFRVMELDAQGKPVLDHKAYQDALNEWGSKVKPALADIKKSKAMQGRATASAPSTGAQGGGKLVQSALTASDDDKNMFLEARGAIVEATNIALGKIKQEDAATSSKAKAENAKAQAAAAAKAKDSKKPAAKNGGTQDGEAGSAGDPDRRGASGQALANSGGSAASKVSGALKNPALPPVAAPSGASTAASAASSGNPQNKHVNAPADAAAAPGKKTYQKHWNAPVEERPADPYATDVYVTLTPADLESALNTIRGR